MKTQRKLMPQKQSFLVLMLLFTYALTAQWEVSTCADMGFTDSMGEGILQNYFHTDPDTGIGGLGCWVHHHTNNKDYVVTPHSWGREPSPGHRALIRATMEAMTDARTLYSTLGSLDNALIYVLNDIDYDDYDGKAFWIERGQCWMRSGTPNLRRQGSIENQKQLMAHEVAHCFIMENVPSLNRDNYSLNEWMDEGIAEYLSSMVYPENNFEHRFARDFRLDDHTFVSQKYNNYIFWQYYGNHFDRIERVDEMMESLVSQPTVKKQLDVLRSKNMDRMLQHVYFEHYQRRLIDPGGGTLPREEFVFSGEDIFYFEPGTTTPFKAKPMEKARMYLYEMVLPAGYDVSLRYSVRGYNKPFLSVISERTSLRDWEDKVLIEGSCDAETNIEVLASHLFFHDIERFQITYELKERTDCCTITEENPSVEKLNGAFSFDYYIESKATTLGDGEKTVLPLNYYVNSQDGSMLFTRETVERSFGSYSGGGMDLDAVIMFPNGQLAAYVIDKNFGQKRVITLDMNQTRGNIMGIQALKMAEFLERAPGSGVTPQNLPKFSKWEDESRGYAYFMEDRRDPSERVKVSAYFSNEDAAATSPLSNFGFMVGFAKDPENRPKKLVYSHSELPDGSFIDVHLNSFEKGCADFDGSGYKKMTLAGYTGNFSVMTEADVDDFAKRQEAYNEEFKAIMAKMGACGTNEDCLAKVQKELVELTRKREADVFNLPEDPSHSGTAGTTFKSKQQKIRAQMLALQEQLIDKELECTKLGKIKCTGGCPGLKARIKNCKLQYEALKEEYHKLDCQMAKLMGVEDMMDDCE